MRFGKKGAIPVPYIVAILLGVVVIALIGLWFFTTTGTGSGVASEAACNAKKVAYCQELVARGTATLVSSSDVEDACEGFMGTFDDNFGDPEKCREFLGIG